MPILADGTIKKTIHKQAGASQYLWSVRYNQYGETKISIFSFHRDALNFVNNLESANLTSFQIELAVDNTRLFSYGAVGRSRKAKVGE